MILPTKHLPLDKSAIGASAVVLRNLTEPRTVSELWEEVSKAGISTFDQFVMALDLLYTLGALDQLEGRLAAA
jgi:hypothetical protein